MKTRKILQVLFIAVCTFCLVGVVEIKADIPLPVTNPGFDDGWNGWTIKYSGIEGTETYLTPYIDYAGYAHTGWVGSISEEHGGIGDHITGFYQSVMMPEDVPEDSKDDIVKYSFYVEPYWNFFSYNWDVGGAYIQIGYDVVNFKAYYDNYNNFSYLGYNTPDGWTIELYNIYGCYKITTDDLRPDFNPGSSVPVGFFGNTYGYHDIGSGFLIDEIQLTVDHVPIPEPATLALLGLGSLMLFRRRKCS